MTRFSIIVPYLEPSDAFDGTLASVLRYRPAASEVIVVHDGTYHDPYKLKPEVRLVAAQRDSVAGNRFFEMLTAGVRHCESEVSVWLRPGVELDEGWEHSVTEALHDEHVASVSPLIVARHRAQEVICAGIETDRRGTRLFSGAGMKVAATAVNTLEPIGPSSWLGAWRTNLLKSILPVTANVADIYLDTEIAFILRELGYTSSVNFGFVGYVDDSDSIFEQSQTPHGDCAQRGFEKFLKSSPANSLATNMLGDLVRSVVSPWHFKHAIQRLTSIKWRQIDRGQIDQLYNVDGGELAAEVQSEKAFARAA